MCLVSKGVQYTEPHSHRHNATMTCHSDMTISSYCGTPAGSKLEKLLLRGGMAPLHLISTTRMDALIPFLEHNLTPDAQIPRDPFRYRPSRAHCNAGATSIHRYPELISSQQPS